MVTLLVTGVVIYRRNYQIVSRTEALEMKMGNRGRSRSTYPWRGKESFDRCGSRSSQSDLDVFETSAPSYPSFQGPQQEANRCVEIEPYPPLAGIVRSAVSFTPAAYTSGPDRRRPSVSQFMANVEDGRQSGVDRKRRLNPVTEEDSF